MKRLIKLAKMNKHLPVLRAVMFDGATAVATNMDVCIVLECKQDLNAPVLVPADDLAAALPVAKTLTITSTHINGVPFAKLPAEEWPIMPTLGATVAGPFTVPLKTLKDVSRAMAKDDVRYYLNGVHFDFDAATIVATDGHRLHAHNGATVPCVKKTSTIAPRDFILAAIASKAVDFIAYENGIEARTADCRILAKRIDGGYLDYARVTPKRKDANVVAKAPIATLRAALKTLAPLSNEKFRGVTVEGANISVPDKLTIPSGFDQPVPTVGFNLCYLQDVAECVGDAAAWEFRDSNSPLCVRDGDFTAVVMPMRI